MKSFPKPLSAKEEKEILNQCKEGSKEARDTLIERNLRLVAHIVKKYNMADKEIDDLISIGTIGLIKAIDTFDADKGIRLATYASRCIDNELLMMLRSGKRQAKEVYLYEPIGSDAADIIGLNPQISPKRRKVTVILNNGLNIGK